MPWVDYFENITEDFPGNELEQAIIAARKRIYDAWEERHAAQDETMNIQITGNTEVKK